MLRIVLVVAAVCGALQQTSGASLPSYIQPCKKDDPKLSECIINHANSAFPSLVKGDPSIKLPPLDPYHLPEVDIKTPGDLKLKFTNADMLGLSAIKYTSASFDPAKGKWHMSGSVPQVTLVGTYTIDGKILVLPITGTGPANITMEGVKFDYNMEFDKNKGGDGKEYIKTKSSKLDLSPDVTHYKLDNLFNGDAKLGDEMNKFLNENHKEVGKDLNPLIAEVVNSIVTHILNTLIEKVPYDELFL